MTDDPVGRAAIVQYVRDEAQWRSDAYPSADSAGALFRFANFVEAMPDDDPRLAVLSMIYASDSDALLADLAEVEMEQEHE